MTAAARWAVAAAAILGAAACRHPQAGEPMRHTVYQSGESITVRVVNHNPLDVVIYALHSGVRDRLGSVTAVSSARFTVPLRSLGAGHEYQLYADPVGSLGSAQTEMLHAQDGDVVTWTLETDLARSSVEVH